MSKLLSLKHERVRRLADLNTEAEKAVRGPRLDRCEAFHVLHHSSFVCSALQQARHLSLSHEFQRQYASVIIDLDDLNRVSFLSYPGFGDRVTQ